MSMNEMQAEHILGIIAGEERSEGHQLTLDNLGLTAVIFEVFIPKIDKRDQPRVKL